MATMINIDFRDRRPIYEQLIAAIKDQILRGLLAEDEQLPSVRALSSELGINPNTIQKAYSELERQGITYTVPGKGCFVSNTHEKMLELKTKDILQRIAGTAREAAEIKVDLALLEQALQKGYYGGDSKQ